MENSIFALLLALFTGILGLKIAIKSSIESLQNGNARDHWFLSQFIEPKTSSLSIESEEQDIQSVLFNSFISDYGFGFWKEAAHACQETVDKLTLKLKEPVQLLPKRKSQSHTRSHSNAGYFYFLFEQSLYCNQRQSGPNNYIRKGK
jgi:hypothetical protein